MTQETTRTGSEGAGGTGIVLPPRVRRFRPATDLERLFKIQAESDEPDPYTRRDFMLHHELHSRADGRSYVKRLVVAVGPDDAPLAFISFTSGRALLSLDALVVAPAWRRRGVGSSLLQRLLHTRNPDCARPGVFCGVRASNLGAQLFLKANAVSCVGEASPSAFSSPDEAALVFLHWHSPPCPPSAREKALSLWRGSAPPRRR